MSATLGVSAPLPQAFKAADDQGLGSGPRSIQIGARGCRTALGRPGEKGELRTLSVRFSEAGN